MNIFTWTPLELAANIMTALCICLQIFFLITGVIGWIGWNAKNDNGVLKITNTPSDQLVTYLVSAILVAVAYGMLLHKFTDAYAPFVDSVVLTMSVVGQFMLMRKRIESWGIWLIVNTISVPLFWSRELYLTSILYGFFWINAIVSYFQWRKIQRLESVV
jgi:nicotinamide mononucleotide transporter